MGPIFSQETNASYLLFLLILIITINSCNKSDSKAFINYPAEEECTIGVASGKATADGRPLLWKTRDYRPDYNILHYTETDRYNFISNITTSYGFNKSWMGVNEKGFAIINSLSSDLKKSSYGPGNGEFMHIALGLCSTVEEFQQLLDSTNITGRTTIANFGVIDSTGAAVMYETAGKEYWKFDANDENKSPEHYILRTNFAFNGGGSGGLQRFERTNKLIKEFHKGDSLNYKSIIRYQMRDLVDKDNRKVSIPWGGTWGEAPQGYIYCVNSISRPTSIGAVVFHGVSRAEMAKYTTMWTIVGQPAGSIALPFWPVGKPPRLVSSKKRSAFFKVTSNIKSLLFDYRNKNYINTNKLRMSNEKGLWDYSFDTEDQIFNSTEEILQSWRLENASKREMLNEEKRMTKKAYNVLKKGYRSLKKSA